MKVHPIKVWLFHKKMTMKSLCEKNNLAYPTMASIVQGKFNPSWKMAKRIEKATNGEIDAETLLTWEPEKR